MAPLAALGQIPPPANRMSGVIRLPPVQDVVGPVTRQLQASLMHFDALRRVKTTARNRICTAPLASPQMYIYQPSGGTNSPESMATGTPKMNARRLVNKTSGKSAGMV